MKINELIESHSELTDTSASKSAVVLMTRIRLARNLAAQPFPGWAKDAQKREIRDQCMQAVAALPQMKRGLAIPVESLEELQKQILVERHLISRELCHAKSGSGIVISKDQSCVVMVKLPFPNVSSALEEARRRWLDENGREYFKDWSLPRAVMKFRQGFGRLIRSGSDRGAVICLDSRVLKKGYGKSFLRSLPPCRKIGSLDELGKFFAPTA